MSYERRRNPLGIIITGYGFAGPSRVARRGFRGFGRPGYFYGLGADATYRAGSDAPSTAAIEAAREAEIAKLQVETELVSRPDPLVEATANLRMMDQQLAMERAAQATVNERGESLYPERALEVAPELAAAKRAEQEVYADAVRRQSLQDALAPGGGLTARDLQPPTTDDPKAWMAFEAALARKTGVVPPGDAGVAPGGTQPLLPPAEPSGTPSVPAPSGVLPVAPAPAAGASNMMLLGGAALALFLLLR